MSFKTFPLKKYLFGLLQTNFLNSIGREGGGVNQATNNLKLKFQQQQKITYFIPIHNPFPSDLFYILSVYGLDQIHLWPKNPGMRIRFRPKNRIRGSVRQTKGDF